MKELDITQAKARKLVKKICEDFELPTCKAFFVDHLDELDGNTLGLYIEADFDENGIPAFMLIEKRWSRKLILVLHEATHHLQNIKYDGLGHSKTWTLAKGRISTWAKNNISDNFDWFCLLTSTTTGKMKWKKKKKKKK